MKRKPIILIAAVLIGIAVLSGLAATAAMAIFEAYRKDACVKPPARTVTIDGWAQGVDGQSYLYSQALQCWVLMD